MHSLSLQTVATQRQSQSLMCHLLPLTTHLQRKTSQSIRSLMILLSVNTLWRLGLKYKCPMTTLRAHLRHFSLSMTSQYECSRAKSLLSAAQLWLQTSFTIWVSQHFSMCLLTPLSKFQPFVGTQRPSLWLTCLLLPLTISRRKISHLVR